jgi:hypothetical protein
MNAPKKKTSKHKFNILGRKQASKEEDPPTQDPKLLLVNQKPKQRIISKNASSRNQSVERQKPQDDAFVHPGTISNGNQNLQPPPSHSSRSVPGRAADNLGRAAKGLLGKLSNRTGLGDSSHSNDRVIKGQQSHSDLEAQKAALTKNYKIVNLPLEEQTRTTRICKRLEDCKDKTEFWLPAVAYRCIDYLNDKGMTHEGLYRVPGSEREIRNWIFRFDNGMLYPSLNDNGTQLNLNRIRY